MISRISANIGTNKYNNIGNLSFIENFLIIAFQMVFTLPLSFHKIKKHKIKYQTNLLVKPIAKPSGMKLMSINKIFAAIGIKNITPKIAVLLKRSKIPAII